MRLHTFLQILFQCQDILTVAVFIGHVVHDLLRHKDAQAADLALMCGKRHVRVHLGQRVVGHAVVHKGDRHGNGLICNLHAHDRFALVA